MDILYAFSQIVQVTRKAYCMDEALRSLGYANTPYAEIYGSLADVLYILLDEDTETFDSSVTYKALTDRTRTDEQCAAWLAHLYEMRIANDDLNGRMVI